MFKKSGKNKIDEYGFSSDLDFDFPEYGDSKIKDDRNPISKLKSGFKEGATSTLKSPGFIRTMVKNSLPKEYGDTFELADSVTGSIKSVYSDAVSEMKPVLADLKRTTNRLLPSLEPVLPSSVAAKIKSWTTPDSKFRDMSAEEQRTAMLTMQLGEIFKLQTTAGMQATAENRARDVLRESIDHSRHKDMFGQMDAMRISLQQLANYKTKIESNYQRKSLELQYRSYFIAQDLLLETKRANEAAKLNLEGILKNTGLPEYVKLTAPERLKEVLRNKFIDAASNNLINARGQFIQKVGSNIGRVVKDKAREFAGNVQTGLFATDMALDIMEQNREMGIDGTHSLGNVAGNLGTEYIGTRFGKGIRKKFDKYVPENNWAKRGIHKAGYLNENLPQLATDWERNRNDLNRPERSGILGKAAGLFDSDGKLGWLGDILGESIRGANAVDNSLIGDKTGNMQDPFHFTRGASKSVTEVIPGYLSRIYQELQIIRTGNDKIELVKYDYNSNRFSTGTEISKKLLEEITGNKQHSPEELKNIKKEIDSLEKKKKELEANNLTKNLIGKDKDTLSDSENNRLAFLNYSYSSGSSGNYTKQQLDKIIDSLDVTNKKLTGKPLTPEQRNVLVKHILNDNRHNRSGSLKRLGNENTYTGDAGKHRNIFANLFNEHLKDKKTEREFSSEFNRVGIYETDYRKAIQDHLNVGNRDLLEELGILDSDSDIINDKKINDYIATGELGLSKTNESKPGYKKPSFKRTYVKKADGGRIIETNPKLRNSGLDTVDGKLMHGEYVLPTDTVNAVGVDKLDALRNATHKPHFANGGSVRKGTVTAKEILKAIVDINTTLLGIDKKITGVFNSSKSNTTGFWNHSIKDLAAMAYNTGSNVASKVRTVGGKLLHRGIVAGRSGLEFTSNAISRGLDKISTLDDIFVKGELEPRLLAWKLEAGHYVDSKTGKVIKSYRDITGSVKDITKGKNGKIVLSANEVKDSFIKSNLGVKFISALGAALSSAKELGSKVLSGFTGNFGSLVDIGKSIITKTYGLLNLPQDVYTKDKPDEPTLLAKSMKVGGYTSRITGKLIYCPADIDGPVIDDLGNTVLTKEDIAKGLFDINGKPIRSGIDKLIGFGKDILVSGIHKARRGFEFIKDKSIAAVKAVGSFVGGVLNDGLHVNIGNSTGIGNSNVIVTRLTQIRDLINIGLPASKRSHFDDSINDVKSTFTNTVSKGKATISNILNGGDAKDVYVKGDPNPRLLALKIKAGDYRNQSGFFTSIKTHKDIKGAVVDEKNNVVLRDSELQDAYVMTDTGPKMLSSFGMLSKLIKGFISKIGNGLLSGASNLLNRFRGRGKLGAVAGGLGLAAGAVSGDEGSSGIGVGDVASQVGADLAISKLEKNAAEKAAMAGTETVAKKSLLKGALKLGAKGLGLAGLAYGGYSAYNNFKEGNIGEGVLDTGLAGVGAASMYGAGSLAGISSLLAAPVLLPALGILAVGTAAYFGYKYLNRKKLDTISKIRYAQYGFAPNDTDHYSQIFGLEDILLKAISYKNGTAELDESKIQTKDVLKAFNIDPAKNDELKNFLSWFNNRFKPVYFVHLSVLNAIAPGKSLDDVDSLKPEEKKKYLDGIKFPEGPYGYDASPFPKGGSLIATKSDVSKLYDAAIDELKKDTDTKKNSITGLGLAGDTVSTKPTIVMPKANSTFTNIVDSLKVGTATAGANALSTAKNISTIGKTIAMGATTAGANALSTAKNISTIGKTIAMGATAGATTGINSGDISSAAIGSYSGAVEAAKKSYSELTSTPSSSAEHKKAILAAMDKANIKDPKERAAFMATVVHETGNFKSVSEGSYKPDTVWKLRGSTLSKLGITKEMVDAAYAAYGSGAMFDFMYGDKYRTGLNRLGNTEDGDGLKYRGRGDIQLTGKSNYARMGSELGLDLLNYPNLLETPEVAADSSVQFWKDRKIGLKLATGGMSAVNQAVNGGMLGLSVGEDDRNRLFDKFLKDPEVTNLPGSSNSPINVADNVNKTSTLPDSSITPTNTFNISDQSPGVINTPGNSSTPFKMVSNESPNVQHFANGGLVTDPAVQAASQGFMSPKARSILAQQDYKKSSMDEALGNVNNVLNNSLSVQQSQLEVLNKIFTIINTKNMGNKSTLESVKAPNVATPDVKKHIESSISPVSMAKVSYG